MTSDAALRLWRIAAVAVTVTVLLLLILPGHRLPGTSVAGLDKLAHLASYVLIGLTWHRAGLPVRWVLGLGLAMAVGTELAQETVAVGREADVRDFLANTAGLVLGVGASRAVGGPSGRHDDDATAPPADHEHG